MAQLLHDFASGVLDRTEGPCLSLYQPTHRPFPGRQEDAIRFKNLVHTLEESLREQYSNRELEPLIAPFHALAEDAGFWRGHMREGLAVFGADGFFRIYQVQRPVPEIAIVAESFHVKPLIRILQSADRYHVLGIDREKMHLYQGNRDQLDEADLPEDFPRTAIDVVGEEEYQRFRDVYAFKVNQPGIAHGAGSGTGIIDKPREAFFRGLDEALLTRVSRPSGLPMLLAGLPENVAEFRRISKNPNLLAFSIDVNVESLEIEDLREQAWRAVEPYYLERLGGFIDQFNARSAHDQGDSDLSRVARSAVEGRIETLLVDADRRVPGRLDLETGAIEYEALSNPDVDDLLDDVAQQVIQGGGEVVMVPSERMPTDTGLAAIYRY